MTTAIPSLDNAILKYLQKGDYELCVNKPGEVWIDRPGHSGMFRVDAPDITLPYLESFSRSVASHNATTLTDDKPILEGTLRSGERIQVVKPPACIPEQFILAIRRPPDQVFEWDPTYRESDYFATTEVLNDAFGEQQSNDTNRQLLAMAQKGYVGRAIEYALANRKSILFCGAMSSGKTTIATSLLAKIPAHERIGVIEDAKELIFPQQNVVRLIANNKLEHRSGARLIEACMRLNLQRLIVGELRNSLIVQFMKTLMVACRGGVSTIHADNQYDAVSLLIDLYREASPHSPIDYIKGLIKRSIDVMVFVSKNGDTRRAHGIYFPSADPTL